MVLINTNVIQIRCIFEISCRVCYLNMDHSVIKNSMTVMSVKFLFIQVIL
jgi:hypothetical protein